MFRNYIQNERIFILDVDKVTANAKRDVSLITSFFLLLSIVGLVLSFFVLWISFASNIRNSFWEIGVLRSIGLSASDIVFVYFYEAIALVLTCVTFGTIIGMTVGTTIIFQFNIILLMPFDLNFPYAMYFSVVGLHYLHLLLVLIGQNSV